MLQRRRDPGRPGLKDDEKREKGDRRRREQTTGRTTKGGTIGVGVGSKRVLG